MKFVIIICLLVGVVFTNNVYEKLNALEAIYGPLTFSSSSEEDFKCKDGETGPVCDTKDPKDCRSFFICIPNVDDPIKGKCKEGQYCDNGICSSNPPARCEYAGLSFTCSNEGMYPDPSSCKKYNYCVLEDDQGKASPSKFAHTHRTCKGDFAYNPVTTFCDKPKKTCTPADRVVPKCSQAGDNGPLKASDSYYYICVQPNPDEDTLYPNIYRCPNNKKYNGKYECK